MSFFRFKKKHKLGVCYKKGTPIFVQGEKGGSLFSVQEGKIALILQTPTRKVRIGIINKGELFGIPHLFGRDTRYCTAIAVENSSVIKIDKRHLIQKMHTDPSTLFNISKTLNDRLMSIVDSCPCECDEFGYCETDKQFPRAEPIE